MVENTPILPVLLSGGSGTRLWPSSRVRAPKQMQKLVGDTSMIQQTALRVCGRTGFAAPIVVCNEAHGPLVLHQLAQAGVADPTLITEPIGRNTAPAIAAAALEAQDRGMSDALLLVLPADHVITNQAAFLEAIAKARIAAGAGYLVTFGIVPTSPHTGYGYVKGGRALDLADDLYILDSFVEKPDRDRAEDYLKSGDYSWNSGMFLFRADCYLEELEAYAPAALAGAKAAFDQAALDGPIRALNRAAFAEAEAISIDYAVMECTRKGAIVPAADLGWSDVGAFDALWVLADKDKADNAVTDGTDAYLIDSQGLYVKGGERVIAAIGTKDLVIVDTPDALLIADRAQVGRTKEIALALAEEGRIEAFEHALIETPAGQNRLLIDNGETGSVHHIIAEDETRFIPLALGDGALSDDEDAWLECWTVIAGHGTLTHEGTRTNLEPGAQITLTPSGERILAPQKGGTITVLVARLRTST
ncbi:MAG: mannose-1-phosphate guanylyltransferase/mannose-6-phosphate isomerase [Alphaproteobacteria bacterium]